MESKVHNWLNTIIGVGVFFLVLVGGNHQPQSMVVGGITTGTNFTHGISVGSTVTLGTVPTNISKILVGTCTGNIDGSSFAASSSAQFVCSVPGAAANDSVSVELPVGAGKNANGAGSLSMGFTVVSTYASSSNQIGFTLDNFTGAATSSFAQATTGVSYTVIGTQ